eukprot:s672_g10.t1
MSYSAIILVMLLGGLGRLLKTVEAPFGLSDFDGETLVLVDRSAGTGPPIFRVVQLESAGKIISLMFMQDLESKYSIAAKTL